MYRFRRVALSALVALALLGAGAALDSSDPTFNPQPDPPGVQAGVIINDGPQAGVIINQGPQAGIIIQDGPVAGIIVNERPQASIIVHDSPAA